MDVLIFADGSSLGNPGPGGFGALIKKDGKKFVVKGGEPDTTNNRMEMSAIIASLYWLHKKFPEVKTCSVFSDSQLVISTLNHGWKRKKNLDLWKKLDALVEKFDEISWHWVRGHSGHPENTQADKIAWREAKKLQQLLHKK